MFISKGLFLTNLLKALSGDFDLSKKGSSCDSALMKFLNFVV
jgi:hypothetical protein